MNDRFPGTQSELKDRLKSAYTRFLTTAETREREHVESMMQLAHEGTIKLLNGEQAHAHAHELAHAWSLINDDISPLAETAADKSLPVVAPDGHIVGFGKYELLDPGYVESIIQWLEHLCNKAKFGNAPATIIIPDTTSIAIVGDWGTGNWREDAPSQKVAQAVRERVPDYSIHLGDVYYAGMEAEENGNFLQLWPYGSRQSFTLNSNHEMYNGAHGYFSTTLANPAFQSQNATSYFALENTHWIIVGLDTAYDANEFEVYMHGRLSQAQLDFLTVIKAKAETEGKKTIVLSHHCGLALTGDPCQPLWDQVTGALGSTLAYWYWGHVHAAVAYKAQNGILCRCCGHGAIPYGAASELDGNNEIAWRETETADDPQIPLRILNGFMWLELKEEALSERFIDENDQVRWSA